MTDRPEPTEEQSAILSAATETNFNLMINALAGTGKTTTLELVERAVSTRPILYLVFNKDNATHAKKRMLSTTTVKTFNALGHGVWAKATGKVLNLQADGGLGKKSHDLLRQLITETPKNSQAPIRDSYWDVINGVAMAKALGYIPEGKFTQAKPLISRGDFHASLEENPDDLLADLIDTILTRSIQTAYQGFIDFNDQVYMPALFGGTFPQFPLVKADEAQDLSPVNHALLRKLVRRRFIAVGDPWQNIYGFRGAKRGGMEELQKTYSMSPLDLSVSFRCPQAVVENARWRVPHFKWIKPGGHVEVLKTLLPSAIPDASAIICRNNAPLFRTALHLLAAQRSVSVAGSDIGPKIIAIMKKLGNDSMSRQELLSAIADWYEERLAKGSKVANDMAECMRVFAGFGATLGQAIAYAEHLFSQKGTIRLLTGHKAKGMEFDNVFHLDPWLLGEDDQDLNLRYVIQTRSAGNYYEINSDQIEW